MIFFFLFCVRIEFGERVYIRVHVSGSSASDQKAAETTPVHRGRRTVVQTDGLLFQRIAFVRRKGRHDGVRQIAHSRARREQQSERRHVKTSQY